MDNLQKISCLLAEVANTAENFTEQGDERLSRTVKQVYADIHASQKETG
jgi:hypothetical protein